MYNRLDTESKYKRERECQRESKSEGQHGLPGTGPKQVRRRNGDRKHINSTASGSTSGCTEPRKGAYAVLRQLAITITRGRVLPLRPLIDSQTKTKIMPLFYQQGAKGFADVDMDVDACRFRDTSSLAGHFVDRREALSCSSYAGRLMGEVKGLDPGLSLS